MDKFVYILSSPYSGSTLLSFLLGSHPKIATVGELQGVNPALDPMNYLCSCHKQLKDCEFWNEIERLVIKKDSVSSILDSGTQFNPVSENLFSKLQFVNLRNANLNIFRDSIYGLFPRYKKHCDNIVDTNIKYAEAISVYSEKNIFLDSSKRVSAINHLHKKLKTKLRLIHLVKDGRSYLNSCLRRFGQSPPSKMIKAWKIQNLYFKRLSETKFQNRSILIKYDSLCLSPEETLRDLCRFLEVDYAEECLSFPKKKHHILGNDMRLKELSMIKHDQKWKQQLNASQLAIFDKIAGKVNREFGHDG